MAVHDDTIVTLPEMRQYLNITDSDDTSMDNELTSLLDECNDFIKREALGLENILNTTYTDEYYDGNGTPYLYIDNKPIVSVTSLTNDNDVSYGTENTDFYVYGDEGYIQLSSSTFGRGLHNVKVTYQAGWGDVRTNVPLPIKLALKKWAAAIYKGDVVDYSSRFEEGSYANISNEGMPPGVRQLLAPYRKLVIGVVPLI